MPNHLFCMLCHFAEHASQRPSRPNQGYLLKSGRVMGPGHSSAASDTVWLRDLHGLSLLFKICVQMSAELEFMPGTSQHCLPPPTRG